VGNIHQYSRLSFNLGLLVHVAEGDGGEILTFA
jgi:hypothetical protein